MLDKDDPWLRDVSDKDVVDPLTPVARSDRNALLICNLLVFAVFQVNIVPTRLSFAGAETNAFDPGAVKLLSLVLLAYFASAFASAIGAEYRAWRANLDGLRERRELRARYYLDQTLSKSDLLQRKFTQDTDDEITDVRANQIAHFNDVQQRGWQEYKRGYERRMFFDGYVPLALSALNGGAALLTYVGWNVALR